MYSEGSRCFASPSFPGLRDPSVLQLARPLSQASGAGPAARLVVAAGLDRAKDMTGAKLFLNWTSEDAAGGPAVDNVIVPVEPLQSQ